MIPFVVSSLTQAVNPIKLREYLAAGLPVVSTPMPEVERYNHLIHIASSVDKYIEAVSACLAEAPRRTRTGASKRWRERLGQRSWRESPTPFCPPIQDVSERFQ